MGIDKEGWRSNSVVLTKDRARERICLSFDFSPPLKIDSSACLPAIFLLKNLGPTFKSSPKTMTFISEKMKVTPWCAGEGLNLQALAGTSTSRMRVCQFHHPRVPKL